MFIQNDIPGRMASTVSFLLMELAHGLLVLGGYVVMRHGSGQKADRLLMNTMECGSYGEANGSKVHCPVYRTLTLVLCQLNPVCTLIFYVGKKNQLDVTFLYSLFLL